MTKRDVLSIALILALAGVIGLFVSVVAGCSNGDEPKEVYKLPYIGRAERRVETGALLQANIAPTRFVDTTSVRILTDLELLTYEINNFFEFGWAWSDSIAWVDSTGATHYYIEGFAQMKIIGWHIWDGETITHESDLPINWEYVLVSERNARMTAQIDSIIDDFQGGDGE